MIRFVMLTIALLISSTASAQEVGCVKRDAIIETSAIMPGFISPDPVIQPGTVSLDFGVQVRVKGWNNAIISELSAAGNSVRTTCGQIISWSFGAPDNGQKGIGVRNLKVGGVGESKWVALPSALRFAMLPGVLSADFSDLIVAAVPVGNKKYDLVAVRSPTAAKASYPYLNTPTRIATINADLAAITQIPDMHGARLIQFVTKPDGEGAFGIFRVAFVPAEAQ